MVEPSKFLHNGTDEVLTISEIIFTLHLGNFGDLRYFLQWLRPWGCPYPSWM
jgi:hypothetical protein